MLRPRVRDFVTKLDPESLERLNEYLLNQGVNKIPLVDLRMWLLKRAGLQLTDHRTGMIMLRAELHTVKNIAIGPNTVIGQRCILDGRGGISIGQSVNVGSGSSLQTGRHLIDAPDFAAEFAPIVVHDRAWIAEHCRILAGVTIGEGAVIASGSVVARSVQPYEVVGGAPARHIGTRAHPMDYTIDFRRNWV